jgi:uncharacterized membrane protein
VGTGLHLHVRDALRLLRRDGRAQGLAEYGIAVAVISLIGAAAAFTLANHLRVLWTRVMQNLILIVLGI